MIDSWEIFSWFCPTSFRVLFSSLCPADDTHRKLLDRAVSGAWFLTGGVFECAIAHRRSVAVLRMLYKIRYNPVLPLNGALPGPYVPVVLTRGAPVAQRYIYASPRCRTSQYSRTFILLSVSLWNDLANPVFDGVGLAGFKSRVNVFLLTYAAISLLQSSTIFPFFFCLSMGWYCGAGVFGLTGCISLSLSIALLTFFNNNNMAIKTSLFRSRCTTFHIHFFCLPVSSITLSNIIPAGAIRFNLRGSPGRLQKKKQQSHFDNSN